MADDLRPYIDMLDTVPGDTPRPPEPLTAEAFARAFIHIRGAHNPTADELENDQEVRPCAWCRLAGEQAAEAAAALASPPAPAGLDESPAADDEAANQWQAMYPNVSYAARVAVRLWNRLIVAEASSPAPTGLDEAVQAAFDGGVLDYTFTPEQQLLIDALRAATRPAEEGPTECGDCGHPRAHHMAEFGCYCRCATARPAPAGLDRGRADR